MEKSIVFQDRTQRPQRNSLGVNYDLTTDIYAEGTREVWAIIYDGATIKYYINGVFKGSIAASGLIFVFDSIGYSFNNTAYIAISVVLIPYIILINLY